jgi:hypothetical protein
VKFWRRRNEAIETGELVSGAADLDDEVARFERSLEKPATSAPAVRRRRVRRFVRRPALKPRRPKGLPPRMPKSVLGPRTPVPRESPLASRLSDALDRLRNRLGGRP